MSVKVEQCDRESTASITVLNEMRRLILKGKADHHHVVQAFAAYRVATTQKMKGP